jgi:hypothetical protein
MLGCESSLNPSALNQHQVRIHLARPQAALRSHPGQQQRDGIACRQNCEESGCTASPSPPSPGARRLPVRPAASRAHPESPHAECRYLAFASPTSRAQRAQPAARATAPRAIRATIPRAAARHQQRSTPQQSRMKRAASPNPHLKEAHTVLASSQLESVFPAADSACARLPASLSRRVSL